MLDKNNLLSEINIKEVLNRLSEKGFNDWDWFESLRLNESLHPSQNSLGQEIKNPENFWRWFGDSITVDEKGRPLVVYHGSDAKFNTFEIDYPRNALGNFKGAYFVDNIPEAKDYGDNIIAVYVRIEKPLIGNPYEEYAKAKGIDYRANFFNIKKAEVEDWIKEIGFDGIIRPRGSQYNLEGMEVIPFSAEQIKSVDNNGEWSDSNNIYESTDKYYYKQKYVDNLMRQNAEVETLTEEQHEVLRWLAAYRHEFHTSFDSIFHDNSTIYHEIDNGDTSPINNKLEEVGLPRIDWSVSMDLVPTEFWLETDFDKTEDDFETYDEYEEAREIFRIELFNECYEQLEKLNKDIENYLTEIDKKHGTHYAPTGIARMRKYENLNEVLAYAGAGVDYVFNANQIKSVDNNGTRSFSSENIYEDYKETAGTIEDYKNLGKLKIELPKYEVVKMDKIGLLGLATYDGVIEINNRAEKIDFDHEIAHQLSNGNKTLSLAIMSNYGDAFGRFNIDKMKFEGLGENPEESFAHAYSLYINYSNILKEKYPKTYQAMEYILNNITNLKEVQDKFYAEYEKSINESLDFQTKEPSMKIVAYHGGDLDKGIHEGHLYFTDDIETAKLYGRDSNSNYKIYKCELTFENPLVLDDEEYDEYMQQMDSWQQPLEEGYDSIICKENPEFNDPYYYVALKPMKQVKILKVIKPLKEKSFNEAGYNWGKGMSNNAVDAYANGEKPISKWTKELIINAFKEELKEAHPHVLDTFSDILKDEDKLFNYLNSLNKKQLQELLLDKSSWHHTSKYYNKTDFYRVDINIALDRLNYDEDFEKFNRGVKNERLEKVELKYGNDIIDTVVSFSPSSYELQGLLNKYKALRVMLAKEPGKSDYELVCIPTASGDHGLLGKWLLMQGYDVDRETFYHIVQGISKPYLTLDSYYIDDKEELKNQLLEELKSVTKEDNQEQLNNLIDSVKQLFEKLPPNVDYEAVEYAISGLV